MNFWRKLGKILPFVLFLGGSACFQSADTRVDEEKDPHFVEGRNRISSQDTKAAIEEFEKALESNPRSAAAHFELGLLYEGIKDSAAAIYHYDRHLQLRPQSAYAERARERIRACKMDLARTEVFGPVTQGMQRDLERLQSENTQLRHQVEQLQVQLASKVAQAPPANLITRDAVPRMEKAVDPPKAGNNSGLASKTNRPIARAPASERPRTHTVKSGDSVNSIARQYGLKSSVLLAANPHVDPRRLKVGQTLTLPQ